MGASTKLADLAHRTFILGVFGATGKTSSPLSLSLSLIQPLTGKQFRILPRFSLTLLPHFTKRKGKKIYSRLFTTFFFYFYYFTKKKTRMDIYFSLHWSWNCPIGQCSYREEQDHEGYLGRCKHKQNQNPKKKKYNYFRA
jgi:hypothetical protein